MPKTNDAALDAFIAAKTEIETMRARLAVLTGDHFGFSVSGGYAPLSFRLRGAVMG